MNFEEIAKLLGYTFTLEDSIITMCKEGRMWTFVKAFDVQDREEYYLDYEGPRELQTKLINDVNYVTVEDFVDYFFLSMSNEEGIIHIDFEANDYKDFTDVTKIGVNQAVMGAQGIELVHDSLVGHLYEIRGDKIYYIAHVADENGVRYSRLLRSDLDGSNSEIIIDRSVRSYKINEDMSYILYSFYEGGYVERDELYRIKLPQS